MNALARWFSRPMTDRLRDISWREHHEGAVHTFRVRHLALPGCTLAMLFIAGLLAIYVVLVERWTGGPLFVPGLVMMVTPVALLTAAAAIGEAADLRALRIRLDPERLVYGHDLARPTVTCATADIEAFVAGEYGVRVRGRDGSTIAWFPCSAPSFVAGKLQEALDDVRLPRAYRE
jgi:hypothetical protein